MDLNIENYTNGDLQELFELEQNYNQDMVISQQNKIKNKILSDLSLGENTRQEIIEFIQKVREKLSETIKKTELTLSKIYHTDTELATSNITPAGGTFVIEQKRDAYLYSKPSEFFRGNLNPLDTRTIKKNITIDSRFRENYYTTVSTNFLLDLPVQFKEVMSMELQTIELPLTYWVFSNNNLNTFFNIEINGSNQTIIIQNGNYSITALINYINAELNALPKPFSFVFFTANLDSTNSGSGNVIAGIVPTSPTIFEFTLNFQADQFGNPDLGTPLPMKLGWYLGFRSGIYIGNSSYVSEAAPDIIGSRYFFLVVEDFQANKADTFYSLFNSSFLSKNILARINNNQTAFTSLSQSGLNIITNKRHYFGPINLRKIKIQLINEYGTVVNLNNQDFSFSINIECSYSV